MPFSVNFLNPPSFRMASSLAFICLRDSSTGDMRRPLVSLDVSSLKNPTALNPLQIVWSIGGWGVSPARKWFRFVRACVRYAGSGCLVESHRKSPRLHFSFFLDGTPSFPFSLFGETSFPFSLPSTPKHPIQSYLGCFPRVSGLCDSCGSTAV